MVAIVEWASSAQGPWTNNWSGLNAVLPNSNKTAQVAVPMFYRVRSEAWTNPPPPGMAIIPAGEFVMGNSMDPSEGWANELPTHKVYVSAFYMDKYEVTKTLWDEVYNWGTNHGYSFDFNASSRAPTHPVAQDLTWNDAVRWCNARSEKEGITPAYYTDAGLSVRYRIGQVVPYVKWTSGYRLPTEAEWEKAARGGENSRRFPWGDAIKHSQANYSSSSSYAYDISLTRGVHPAFNSSDLPYSNRVGYFAPNGFGLYDMVGNVWEWCWDWYDSSYYSSSPESDPRGPSVGPFHIMRGGCWCDDPRFCRISLRTGTLDFWHNVTGFRAVMPACQP